jgi:GH15 family glucan-1,4-alpha-glucosidase
MSRDYPAIEDHGLIGDLQTAALVARDGTITWFCTPRFDSPSVFGAILDPERGGHFRIGPEGTPYTSRQLYLPGTPILVTRFLSADGVGEVTDFMPVAGDTATGRHRIVRMVQVIRGQMRFRVECAPAFNYGRDSHEIELADAGAVLRSGDSAITLHAVRHDGPLLDEEGMRVIEGRVQAAATLSAGDVGGIVLETSGDGSARVIHPDEVLAMFDQTRDYWRGWIGRCQYTGRWREMVERSAMTLKLLTYAPTGAIVAAPTAGLPEQIGGERNWDYRFTWVRDGSFSVYASRFLQWLGARIAEAADSASPLQIMYRIDGSPVGGEEILGHLSGYRDSRPVRIGNGAADQLQLDIYGEAMDSLYLAAGSVTELSHQGWQRTARLIDWLSDHWDQRDDGIWETRSGAQNFTYGRVMSWVAFDRALRLARRYGRPADTTRWTAARDAVYEQVMTHGFHPGRQAFVQHYDTDVLDAALLYMPMVGFVTPSDPLWQSTLRAMDEELVSDSLVYRYDPSASPDGLAGDEGTFTICSFWYVDALARSGRLDEARLVFEKMLTYANPLGLYSEEIAATGEQIGNFPQAFSHLSLISAAVNLDRRLG